VVATPHWRCIRASELENNYSLNTVDICPVGALTSNDFRFQQRVWFLTETNSICTGCGRGCNMEIGARGDTVYRQTPRDNNDVNSTWMCDQGRLDFHFVNSEFRLTDPMLKTGGNPSQRDRHLENALSCNIATEAGRQEAVKKSPSSPAARMTNEELFFVKHLAATNSAPTNVDVIPRTGGADNYLRADDLNPNSERCAPDSRHRAGSQADRKSPA
jgi:NADH-quinone oxidoreductase subunit G